MFDGCVNLKGAVSYDASCINATYANPDTGYFTRKFVMAAEGWNWPPSVATSAAAWRDC